MTIDRCVMGPCIVVDAILTRPADVACAVLIIFIALFSFLGR